MRKLIALFLLLSLPAQAAVPLDPDAALTPGLTRDLTLEEICRIRWGEDHRFVNHAMKRQVLLRYGATPDDCDSHEIEIDHLVPRSLGGADDVRNLWAQCYEPQGSPMMGAYHKDRMERYLHQQVCAGKIDLGQAQGMFLHWRDSYVQVFSAPRARHHRQ